MSSKKSMSNTNNYANEYFDFEGDIQLWDKYENGEYYVSGFEPRLVIGTRAKVEESLKTYGTPDEEESMPREFPYWCNGEALIVYMKNGFLYYVIR
jgi:hypothetical protein